MPFADGGSETTTGTNEARDTAAVVLCSANNGTGLVPPKPSTSPAPQPSSHTTYPPRAAQIRGNFLHGCTSGTWGGCGAGSGPVTCAAATCGPRVDVGINLSSTTVVTPGRTSRVTRRLS